jgi:hypothetical protein
MHYWRKVVLAGMLGVWLIPLPAPAQQAGINLDLLNESGKVLFNGRLTPYLIRRLPVSSFPQLPAWIQAELNLRSCLIPQTYQAYGPENVIHGSLERPGSSDWAVLCSARGTVSLLVFFGDGTQPSVLASAPETERLTVSGPSGVLGFDWGIDPATPAQVRQAEANITPRPPPLDHDAVASTVINRNTVYHYYAKDAWILVAVTQ